MWFVGIDWSQRHHDCVVLDQDGRRIGRIRVAHSAEGIAQLCAWLRAQACQASATGPEEASADPEQLFCVLETSHGLLITALLDAGFPVYPVNPKTVDHARGAAGAKTDEIDAHLLAKHGFANRWELRRLAPDRPLVAELKALTRDQDLLVHEQTRLVNRLIAALRTYYPVALELFDRLHQPSALAFLARYPTPEQARRAPRLELAAFVHEQPHFPQPERTVERLWRLLQASPLVAEPVTTRTKARLVAVLVRQLQALHDDTAAYDQEIMRLFRTHPDSALFSSLPSCGGKAKRLAPRLLAEIGDDRARYEQRAGLQALAGTAPRPRSSGMVATAQKRRAGVRPLRNVLHQFARCSIREEEWAAAYYQKKRREGKRHHAAVRALANVWTRIISAMWQSQTRYDVATFRAAQAAHSRPAA
jgi:Transposase/Transposase IS116/IS110/IS902 family